MRIHIEDRQYADLAAQIASTAIRRGNRLDSGCVSCGGKGCASCGGHESNPVSAADRGDRVAFSPESLALATSAHHDHEPNESTEGGSGEGELSTEERQQVAKMQARDLAVRAHEQAHAAAAGDLALSGPKLTTERGPDGRQYAVAGEVSIDTSPVEGDPEATIRKAARIQGAALAPADPSSQDQAVAQQAAAMAARARSELAAQRTESGNELDVEL